MHLIIRGECTALTKPEARFACQWAARELLGKRLAKNITIYVNFSEMDPDEYGDCMPIMKDDVGPYRKFNINISNTRHRSRQLGTIFHEMVHVKQFARAELDYTDNINQSYWRRKYLIDEREYDYHELPWEKEASRIQKRMLAKYLSYIEENHISFIDI